MYLLLIVIVLVVMIALLRINNLPEDRSTRQKKSVTSYDDSGWSYGSAEHITSDGGSDSGSGYGLDGGGSDGGSFDGGSSDGGGDSSSSF